MPEASGKTFKLADGRDLGYAEYGDPAGEVLFYIHGHPGTRLEAGFLASTAITQGVRLIAPDQPGLGLSTHQPDRRLLDWPDDVASLADHLKIGSFGVVGFSGGGPHALACAQKIPDRLTCCGVVSSVGRSPWIVSFLGKWLPWIILPPTKKHFASEETARQFVAKLARKWPEPDRRVYEDLPWVQEVMIASLVESFRQGVRGAAREGKLIAARHWGFELEAVKMPVLLWHGELDNQVPVAQARNLAGRLAKCRPKYYPNDGHISTIVNNRHAILSELTAGRR